MRRIDVPQVVITALIATIFIALFKNFGAQLPGPIGRGFAAL